MSVMRENSEHLDRDRDPGVDAPAHSRSHLLVLSGILSILVLIAGCRTVEHVHPNVLNARLVQIELTKPPDQSVDQTTGSIPQDKSDAAADSTDQSQHPQFVRLYVHDEKDPDRVTLDMHVRARPGMRLVFDQFALRGFPDPDNPKGMNTVIPAATRQEWVLPSLPEASADFQPSRTDRFYLSQFLTREEHYQPTQKPVTSQVLEKLEDAAGGDQAAFAAAYYSIFKGLSVEVQRRREFPPDAWPAREGQEPIPWDELTVVWDGINRYDVLIAAKSDAKSYEDLLFSIDPPRRRKLFQSTDPTFLAPLKKGGITHRSGWLWGSESNTGRFSVDVEIPIRFAGEHEDRFVPIAMTVADLECAYGVSVVALRRSGTFAIPPQEGEREFAFDVPHLYHGDRDLITVGEHKTPCESKKVTLLAPDDELTVIYRPRRDP